MGGADLRAEGRRRRRREGGVFTSWLPSCLSLRSQERPPPLQWHTLRLSSWFGRPVFFVFFFNIFFFSSVK